MLQSDDEFGTVIYQEINKALITGKVTDDFDTAGIRKPDISFYYSRIFVEY